MTELSVFCVRHLRTWTYSFSSYMYSNAPSRLPVGLAWGGVLILCSHVNRCEIRPFDPAQSLRFDELGLDAIL